MTEETKEKPQPETPDEILESSKGEFQSCIVTGINQKGDLFIKTSVQNVPWMHYLLNRSTFELSLFEKQASSPKAEANVDQDAEKQYSIDNSFASELPPPALD